MINRFAQRARPVARLRQAAPLVALLGATTPLWAATLQVGPGQPFATPSAAARAAHDGDTVHIAAGTYFDCAIWHANDLTIEGDAAATTVLTDTACAGKALVIIDGRNTTIRHLTLARARVPDNNGAGIRSEAPDLTVADVRFINDQDGILSGADGGFLRISGASFLDDGAAPDGVPTHAVIAGHLDSLRIEGSRFAQARGGDDIVSAAITTELVGNHLADSGGNMAGPLVQVAGGSLLLAGNEVTLGPGAAARPGVVLLTGDAVALTVRGNTLSGGTVPLVRNWGAVSAVAEGNIMPPGIPAVSDQGSSYHRLRASLARLRDQARHTAGAARHALAVLVRGVL